MKFTRKENIEGNNETIDTVICDLDVARDILHKHFTDMPEAVIYEEWLMADERIAISVKDRRGKIIVQYKEDREQ